MQLQRIELRPRPVSNHSQHIKGKAHGTQGVKRESYWMKNLRVSVDGSLVFKRLQHEDCVHIGLPIIQALNEFWPHHDMYVIEGLNPQDARHRYTKMLNDFQLQVPVSTQLLLAHHSDEFGRSHVLARGESAANGLMNGVCLSRLLRIAKNNWTVTLVDYELSEGEPIEAWIWSLFDTADRLQLGVDRVFVFDGAGCIIAEP